MDIVERLRQPCSSNDALRQRGEAAVEIERLRAQRDQLRAVLYDAENYIATFGEHAETSPILQKVRAAIKAVEEKP